MMNGEPPRRVWVVYPRDGSAPVLWTTSPPDTSEGDAECVEYVLADKDGKAE